MDGEDLVEDGRFGGEECVRDFQTSTQPMLGVQNFGWVSGVPVLGLLQEPGFRRLAVQADGQEDDFLDHFVLLDGFAFVVDLAVVQVLEEDFVQDFVLVDPEQAFVFEPAVQELNVDMGGQFAVPARTFHFFLQLTDLVLVQEGKLQVLGGGDQVVQSDDVI